MDTPLTDFIGQCYDGVSNMVGANTGEATRVKEIESLAPLAHCHSHSLQLALADTIKAIKLMRDTDDAAFELNKPVKCSSKRERAFNRLREETVPRNSGYRTLCPTRWTVRVISLQSILGDWAVFQE